MIKEQNQYSERTIEEVNLKDIILILWKYKITILIFTVLTIIASIIYALRSPVLFQSTSKIITKTASGKSSQMAQLAALAGIRMGGAEDPSPSDYLADIIKDIGFARNILNQKWWYHGDSLRLEQIWGIKPDTTFDNWRYYYDKFEADKLRRGSSITLSKNPKTGLMTLNTMFKTAQLAYDINIFSIGLLEEYIQNSNKSQAKEKRLFIQARIDEVKADLANYEIRLANYKEKNINSLSSRAYLEEQRLLRDVTLNQEIYIQLQKQYEMARIEEKNDQPLLEIVNKPEIAISCTVPNKRMIVTVGCLIGFITGVFVSFMWSWYSVHFRRSK
jgi:uncharacterized protein involved in exopolysaccharide biosynthesis